VTAREASEYLRRNGIESPEAEALELIAFCEGISRAEARFASCTSEKLLNALDERISGTPLQYIIGEWDFMGFTFKVSPHCLIPRADTELLCSYLVENAPYRGRFADLCTGSGCIAVAALALRPDLCCSALELYPEALEIAKENARLLGVSDRIEFILADVTKEGKLSGEFDMIVSNPPYITLDEMNELSPEVHKEPRHALTDGGDGLSIIRKIIEIYPAHLKESAPLAIEIGWKQGEAVSNIAKEAGLKSKILKDIEGRDRVCVMQR